MYELTKTRELRTEREGGILKFMLICFVFDSLHLLLSGRTHNSKSNEIIIIMNSVFSLAGSVDLKSDGKCRY